jgi:tRNA modification GTPase
MKLLDTIAAVSTPYGKGGVAMIRISGADAFLVADKIFRSANGKKLSETEHGKMIYGEIFMPNESISVDDGMAVRFCAPRSFTGEDTVEITCHGGILVTRKVLSAALTAGARHAEAGEFTRRAYISGKMKLTQAEALGDLLEADSESRLLLARNGMRGNLAKEADKIYASLRSVMASMYAAIDFPDEDLAQMSREDIAAVLKDAALCVKKLTNTYKTGRAVNEGIATVICGRANAGKSSVYNRILGYDAAIVTDIEGTTRDVLREKATLGSASLLLCDTAGLRKTEDVVENIGIERTLGALDEAELVLAVFDASSPLTDEDRELIERIASSKKTAIALLNKADRETDALVSLDEATFAKVIRISALTGEGFDTLSETVDGLFIDGSIDISNDAIVTGARQYASLVSASEAIGQSLSDIDAGLPLDLVSVGLESAMSALGEVDGREIGEEIVAEIFSKFCVGK